MILLAVLLLTTLRLISNGFLCLCRRLIHQSAWKEYSAKASALTAFCRKFAWVRSYDVRCLMYNRGSVA